jgi:hypothetical protein
MTTYTCPACGNDDQSLMEHNGEDARAMDFTLLCLGGDVENEAGDNVCGNQWEPNDPEYRDEDEDEGIQGATAGQLRALGREGE